MSMRKLGTLSVVSFLSAVAAMSSGCSTPPPDPATVHRQKGDQHVQKGEFAPAVAEYTLSLEANPQQEKTWEKLSFCEHRLGNLDKAAAATVKMVDFKNTPAEKAEVYRVAAGFYLRSLVFTEIEKAEKYLLEILKLVPGDESSLTWMGEMAAQRGGARNPRAPAQADQLELALGYYDRLIQVRPETQQPYAHKGIILTKYIGDLEAKRLAAEQSLKWKHKAAEVAETKGRIAEFDAKIAPLKKALEDVNAKIAELQKAKSTAKK